MADRGDPWAALADLLDAQAWAADIRARDAQIDEQVAADRATWTLADRLRAVRGRGTVRLHLTGGHMVAGTVAAVGEQWVLLALPTGAIHALAQLAEIVAVSGLTDAGRQAPADPLARAGIQVRAWQQDGTAITVLLRDGRAITSTVWHVQVDHLDLATPEADVMALSAIAGIVAR